MFVFLSNEADRLAAQNVCPQFVEPDVDEHTCPMLDRAITITFRREGGYDHVDIRDAHDIVKAVLMALTLGDSTSLVEVSISGTQG